MAMKNVSPNIIIKNETEKSNKARRIYEVIYKEALLLWSRD